MATRTDLVILRPWRDGSVHAEVATAAFFTEDDVLVTHANDVGNRHRMQSLCGLPFFGRASATGWSHPHRVDCPACRSLLLGEEREDVGPYSDRDPAEQGDVEIYGAGC